MELSRSSSTSSPGIWFFCPQFFHAYLNLADPEWSFYFVFGFNVFLSLADTFSVGLLSISQDQIFWLFRSLGINRLTCVVFQKVVLWPLSSSFCFSLPVMVFLHNLFGCNPLTLIPVFGLFDAFGDDF